jgi:hypothetical protein
MALKKAQVAGIVVLVCLLLLQLHLPFVDIKGLASLALLVTAIYLIIA